MVVKTCTASASLGISRSGLKYAWKCLPVSTRLNISTQPISTIRSPPAGLSTVVSVTKTISRIRSLCIGGFAKASQDVPDRSPCFVEGTIGRNHEIDARAFFGVEHLVAEDA